MKVHATLISAGGIILVGILLVMCVLAWFGGGLFLLLLLLVLAYGVDAASESLEWQKGYVIFDTLLRPKKRVRCPDGTDLLIVHEGLNQERGIVSVRFRTTDGTETRIQLGPFWRKRDLEAFLAKLV